MVFFCLVSPPPPPFSFFSLFFFTWKDKISYSLKCWLGWFHRSERSFAAAAAVAILSRFTWLLHSWCCQSSDVGLYLVAWWLQQSHVWHVVATFFPLSLSLFKKTIQVLCIVSVCVAFTPIFVSFFFLPSLIKMYKVSRIINESLLTFSNFLSLLRCLFFAFSPFFLSLRFLDRHSWCYLGFSLFWSQEDFANLYTVSFLRSISYKYMLLVLHHGGWSHEPVDRWSWHRHLWWPLLSLDSCELVSALWPIMSTHILHVHVVSEDFFFVVLLVPIPPPLQWFSEFLVISWLSPYCILLE